MNITRHELLISGNDDLKAVDCPLPINIIPNMMGINLCSVKSIVWNIQDDDQLVDLVINFIPDND